MFILQKLILSNLNINIFNNLRTFDIRIKKLNYGPALFFAMIPYSCSYSKDVLRSILTRTSNSELNMKSPPLKVKF